MSIRILIVDDHAVVRQGLKMFLALDEELKVVGEAANGEEAIRRAHELTPDVVLMDLLMPVMDGIAATEVIRRELPDVEVIALTSVLEDRAVYGAVRAGAIGYLLKDTQADELCRAIKAAAAGQVQLSPQAALRLMREVQVPHSRGSAPAGPGDVEQRDRRGPGHRRKDSQDAREQHPEQAGRAQPHPGRTLCRAHWSGVGQRGRADA
jgi:NarL family two-component system response regulator LiaR